MDITFKDITENIANKSKKLTEIEHQQDLVEKLGKSSKFL